jgi:hypothetical protein
VGVGEVTPQFDRGQQAEALALIEEMPWGHVDRAIRDMETVLRLAMEATSAEFWWWEEELGPQVEVEYGSEFVVPADVVAEMTDADKLAYVARLLRTLAHAYGVNTEFGLWRDPTIPGQAWDGSPAALLRGLNDISWVPTAGPQSSAMG